MPTDDGPTAGLGLRPRFRPPSPTIDPPLPTEATPTSPDQPIILPPTLPPASLAGDGGRVATGERARRDLDPPSRTAISSAGKPTQAQAGALIAGLLGLVVVGAAALISWRTRRQLRRPTKTQRDDIAAPLGRLLLRHAPDGLVSDDLADLLETGAAFGAYLNDGALLSHPTVDPGLPQEPPHDL